VSDCHLTQQCGFLQLLAPSDIVPADRGFDIDDDLRFYGAKLAIPAHTRGKKKLSLEEVERSKRLSRVCIHVERVTGLLKQKYTILEGPLPVNLIKHKSDGEYAIVDKILTVCAAQIYCECHSVLHAHYHSHQCCTYYVTYCFGHMYMC